VRTTPGLRSVGIAVQGCHYKQCDAGCWDVRRCCGASGCVASWDWEVGEQGSGGGEQLGSGWRALCAAEELGGGGGGGGGEVR
jgi:hypothetical protein